MSDQIDFEEQEENKPRPGFLTVLCVLSFVSIGFGILMGLVNLAMGPSSAEQMLDAQVQMADAINQVESSGMTSLSSLFEKLQRMSEDVNDNFYLAGTLNLIIVLGGLYGVIKMFRGFRLGFHIYIIYCLVSIAAVYLYVSPANIPSGMIIINVFLSGLFIFMYSRNLKWMKQ